MCNCDLSELKGNAAHCSAANCHRTFGSVSGFDRHRRHGHCLDPADLGMVQNKSGRWVSPLPEEYLEKLDRLKKQLK